MELLLFITTGLIVYIIVSVILSNVERHFNQQQRIIHSLEVQNKLYSSKLALMEYAYKTKEQHND